MISGNVWRLLHLLSNPLFDFVSLHPHHFHVFFVLFPFSEETNYQKNEILRRGMNWKCSHLFLLLETNSELLQGWIYIYFFLFFLQWQREWKKILFVKVFFLTVQSNIHKFFSVKKVFVFMEFYVLNLRICDFLLVSSVFKPAPLSHLCNDSNTMDSRVTYLN